MAIRQSPAQLYVLSLLVRGLSNHDVLSDLRDRGLVPLSCRRLDDLRGRYPLPKPFYPRRAKDETSRRFLEQLGIKPLFRRDPAVAEALGITWRPRLQERVETLLIAGANPEQVANAARMPGQSPITKSGVEAYAKYLFDLSRIGTTELRWILRGRGRLKGELLDQDARYGAALLPGCYAGMVLTSIRSGRMPREIDYVRVLEQARGVIACRIAEAAAKGGKAAGQALQFAGAFRVIDEAVGKMVNPNESIISEIEAIQIECDRSPVLNLRELSGGHCTVDLQPAPQGGTSEPFAEEAEEET